MRKKVVKFSILPLIAGSVFFSFSTKEAANLDIFSTSKVENLEYTVISSEDYVPVEEESPRIIPVLGKSYTGFKEALAFKESRGNYKVINEFGYMGKYQFGKGTLNLIGIKDTRLFLNSPELQEAAFYANASRNKWILIRDIKRFEGKVINGIEITESGILAAAHLAGPGSVKKYLRSWGANAFSDAFGTTIGFYLKKFGGYDTSFIEPDKNARAVAFQN
ncbi:peptidoglycan-binding protein LysM [Antarcticibacterium arcticum]|uniref:Peptidoglycan-binding protein LysM n=1 Tax=Antarcticibacterium arcticum TaxID=2585771 RepID=A0A5B8YKY7_9FLAO|nr:peptidoglycan-binding protein LysM [Antarcticibacterium arcticum]QED36369.1 peptidoglycan-binding protein LysM [Antarcticibacterium arcticum]